MSALNQLLAALKVEANVFHNGQYCGVWAVDTSGSQRMTFHIVSVGLCQIQIGDQHIELHQGDAVFLPSDAKHRVSGVSTAQEIEVNQTQSLSMQADLQPDATGLVCGYFDHQNPIFGSLLQELPDYLLIRASANDKGSDEIQASASVLRLILQESISSGQSTNLLLNRLADCLLYLLLRDHVDVESGVFAALMHPKIGVALKAVHADAEQKWNVESLARLAGMSRSAFASLFKEVLGQSPMDYVTQWRMTLAYRLLADEGSTTLAAAISCGYETEASFAKAFKRIMGVGPGQVRRQL